MNNRNYVCLFANCRITKGANRSIICDLQRSKYVLIPNSFADIFLNKRYVNLKDIQTKFSSENLKVFYEYIALLKNNEFAFLCSKKEIKNFPELNLNFEYPAKITNAIIDFNTNTNYNIKDVIQNLLIPSNCRHIQIRCFDEVSFDFLDKIIIEINTSFVKSVDFILKDSFANNYTKVSKWVENNRKIRSLILHSSKENKIIHEENYGFSVIATTKQKIESETHCGIIHHYYFNINIETYTESLHCNSCLNRKIGIDKDGNIKNCPSMKESFGNIKEVQSLEAILTAPGFNKFWNISKDIIKICMHCEFRYICTDCRAYLEVPQDNYSKPLKCGYNPYTNEWREWTSNPLKNKIADFYEIHKNPR